VCVLVLLGISYFVYKEPIISAVTLQICSPFQMFKLMGSFLVSGGHILEGGKGGYRSRFTENKAALSQFTKNSTLAFRASRKIKENVLENYGSRRLWKSRFTRIKMAISHFTGNKKDRSRVTKIPFTTVILEPCTNFMGRFVVQV